MKVYADILPLTHRNVNDGSSPTWQLVTGIGYKVAESATAQFGYRHLYFDRQGGSKFGFDATQDGFIFGLTLHLK